MIGWIADSSRLVWGLFYWNSRKTLFRLRRGRGRCPCQCPSDSGRAMETSCEAALSWHQPARFRRVCPLLKRDAAGLLKCSVNTADVRPFWGRAMIMVGGSLLGGYLAITLAVFLFFRVVGYDVTYPTIAWPPHWPRLTYAKSEYFFGKARTALAEKRVSEAMLALQLAYQYNPDNYNAAFTLAQIYQSAQPGAADQIYGRLLQSHPQQRTATIKAWYLALLARGDFHTIALLARDAAKSDQASAPAWAHAILFALRREPNDALLKSLAEDKELPAFARAIFAIEVQAKEAKPAAIRSALLTEKVALESPYFDYYRASRLIELGFAQDAITLLKHPSSRLNAGNRTSLLLQAYSVLGWQSLVRSEIETLLLQNFNAATIEIICIQLIRSPDPESVNRLFNELAKRPLPAGESLVALQTPLLCAAGAAGDMTHLHEAIAALRKETGGGYKSLDIAHAFFLDPFKGPRVEHVISVLQPLSVEVSYALYERYYQSRPQAAATAKP